MVKNSLQNSFSAYSAEFFFTYFFKVKKFFIFILKYAFFKSIFPPSFAIKKSLEFCAAKLKLCFEVFVYERNSV